jgi:2-oxoglutarate ferredoxin oxidoreductase subunit beta
MEIKDYAGGTSTLCTGCGHDSISKHIISACFKNTLAPAQVIKMSGIGCSSKIPAYFMSSSFAFNSMHGRMGPVATGALLARNDFIYLGVSGDGDTGNIGLGGFLHLIRRNVPMVYIIANNGVFGLTKGQFSASADEDSLSRTGRHSGTPALDFCALALEVGCGFVARTFSGDAKQAVPLIQAALKYKGTAVIDIISPCITFNNHDGSTKSYSFLKDHDHVLQELGLFSGKEEILVDYEEGQSQSVNLHDGSILVLRKIHSMAHDVRNRESALDLLHQSRKSKELLTGLFYFNEERPLLTEALCLTNEPLNTLQEKDLKPTNSQLLQIQGYFR